MYGQMTAGSWIYIGSQGIVQGTYECFAEIARRRFGGSLAGTITLTAGLGGMGGAQPLAVTMNGGVALCVEVDRERIRRRLETRYLDEERRRSRATRSRAAARGEGASGAPLSVGLVRQRGRRRSPRCCALGFEADIVTDQTSAHDPLDGYMPDRPHARRGASACGRTIPSEYIAALARRHGRPLRGDGRLHGRAAPRSSTTATACAPRRSSAASSAPSTIPGFVPAYIRPLFCEGKGPFRWVALSGDPADIAATDRAVLEEFPDDEALARWIRLAGERIAFQGLPARICWLGYGERAGSGCASTRWCAAAS